MTRSLLLGVLVLALPGCVTTAGDVGVVESFTCPPEGPILHPRPEAITRALEAEWPPATAWDPPVPDELRIRPVYRACQPRPTPPVAVRPRHRRHRRWRRRHHRRWRRDRVLDADGDEAVILRVQPTGADSPPLIRLTRDDDDDDD